MAELTNLSLCSGGGGLDYGLELALGSVRTVCWVEWEAFACEFLATAMDKGVLVQAPIWSDLRSFDGRPWRGLVDCLTAGYPCQPFSLAGRRGGQDDPRHLWPHVARVISEVQPRIIFLENVAGHVSLGLREVLGELSELGYLATAGLYSAEEVGSPQERERVFIVAHAESEPRWTGLPIEANGRRGGQSRFTSNPSGAFPPPPDASWQDIPKLLRPATESSLRQLVDGVAEDRSRYLRLLGNGVVPLVAAYAFVSLWACLRGFDCNESSVIQ